MEKGISSLGWKDHAVQLKHGSGMTVVPGEATCPVTGVTLKSSFPTVLQPQEGHALLPTPVRQ